MIAAQRPLALAPGGRRPDWESALNEVVHPAGPDLRSATPLGLQFDVSAPAATGRRGEAPSIRLRPVVPGARGRWVRSGVSWRTLDDDYRSPRDPDHVGTHVASTAMVGRVEVVKMENKGRGFRRLRVRIV